MRILYLIVLFFSINNFAQTSQCGTVIDQTFDTAGALPTGWTEYNTSGRVSVDSGRLKLDYTTDKPAVYHTFGAVTDNFSYSFDVAATRNYVNCNMNLISSTGKYLGSITFALNSNLNIQYATTIVDGIPSGYSGSLIPSNFVTNTTYSLSLNADFTNQKINFYYNGVLMAADVPFLETTQDIAKIDIQLNYMYNNEGRFFFDNISLVSGAANRLLLGTNLTTAENSIASAVIGDKYSQHPQSAVDAFQLAITNSKAILADCNSSSNSIDNSIVELQNAQDAFANSRVNNPILKLYNGNNFTGEEHEVYCGYYNGGLGEYEDWAVSFTLEKGYMATFAQDINGLGVSKVYVAQDSALEINLPSDLQRSISFIRVSPWYPVGKKGSLGYVKWSTADNYNTTWYYNWGLVPTSQTSAAQFVPMAWSKSDNWTSLEKMEEIGKNMSFNHLLAFNEPDNSSQSNMTVAQALEAYPKLLASGLRLGAPGVENIDYSATNDSFNEDSWIKEFMDECVARGYRVDFIPAHDYVRRSKVTFIERFKGLHDRYNLPVWVTEYNYGNPNMGSANLTVEQGYTNIKGLTEGLEEVDFIERYNWYYFFGASSGIGGMTNGELNITGQFYRDLASPAPSYIQEQYEQGPSLSLTDLDKNNKYIRVYPNPVTTPILNLNYTKSLNDATVSVFNAYGQEVMKKTGSPQHIDVTNLSNGFYLIKVSYAGANMTKKIIINK
ncbi:glycosyl hydrolase [Mariniflexile sp.]|uniref:glycosyl hydrolase n=1 Tax=Mariniflexile sp. TaxID=1979402 RepID=UPI003563FC96